MGTTRQTTQPTTDHIDKQTKTRILRPKKEKTNNNDEQPSDPYTSHTTNLSTDKHTHKMGRRLTKANCTLELEHDDETLIVKQPVNKDIHAIASTSNDKNTTLTDSTGDEMDVDDEDDNDDDDYQVLPRVELKTSTISSKEKTFEPMTDQTLAYQPCECKSCCLSFSSVAMYKEHFQTSECAVQCLMCDIQVPDVIALGIHEGLHADSTPDNFLVEFTNIMDIIPEEDDPDKATSLSCNECCVTVDNRRLLITHIIENHSIIYTCKSCDEKFRSKTEVTLHNNCELRCTDSNKEQGEEVVDKKSEDVKDARKFKCTKCGSGFRNIHHLNRHQLALHPEKWHVCEICSKQFPTRDKLQAHTDWHRLSFKCTFENCGKYCKTKYHLRLHMQKHNPKGPFPCTICKKELSSAGKLRHHMKYHATEKKFTCDVCHKSFKTPDVLNVHTRIHAAHMICCEICGKGFHQMGHLRRHIDSHNNVKAHTCDVCNASFARIQSLEVHKLNAEHFKDDKEMYDKTFGCEYCDKRFIKTVRYKYNRHVLIHTSEMPYQCDICERRFNDQSNLKAHKMIHANAKPFRCELCDKSYTHRSNLRAHEETHRKEGEWMDNKQDVALQTRDIHKTKERKQNHKSKKVVATPTPVTSKRQTKEVEATTYIKGSQTHADSAVVSTNQSSKTPVLTPLPTLMHIRNLTTASVNIPINLVYDTSAILPLASMSSGVVEGRSVFHQTTLNLQQKQTDSFHGRLPVDNTNSWHEPPVEPAGEHTDAHVELGECVDIEEEEQSRTWTRMDTMFTCKSPRDIDRTSDSSM